MEPTDVIFAQNWIEQAYIAHLEHPNVSRDSVLDISRRYNTAGLTVISLSVWRYTREGRDVWASRFRVFCDSKLWR